MRSTRKFDGKRMVVGCTKEHLAELVEQYKHRPFAGAELWSGKIARALQKYEGQINEEGLAEETGLTPDQIEAGVTWQNLEYLRWREQFGETILGRLVGRLTRWASAFSPSQGQASSGLLLDAYTGRPVPYGQPNGPSPSWS
jgi:hypothetical protein